MTSLVVVVATAVVVVTAATVVAETAALAVVVEVMAMGWEGGRGVGPSDDMSPAKHEQERKL